MPDDDGVDLLGLVGVLLRRWWLIALFAVLGTLAALWYAKRLPPVFRAQAVIAPPEQKKAGGATAALSAFGGLGAEIAGSMGISLGTTDANRLEALLRSFRLTERVVTRHTLLPVLFAKRWDPALKKWKEKDGEPAPDAWDAKRVLDKVLRIRNDAKAGVLVLTSEFSDPETAKAILGSYLGELAQLIQEDELKKVERDAEFTREQLRRSADPIVIAKLQTMLSEQIEKAMMARNVEHFAFELIDPPAGSSRKVGPIRSRIAAVGGAASLFVGVFAAFFAEWWRNARVRRGQREHRA